MLRLLEDALREIQHELAASGSDEVAENPILRGKQQFVDRAWRCIERWRQS
jgi:hypothetical protein